MSYDWPMAIYAARRALGMSLEEFFRQTPALLSELFRLASGKRRRKALRADNMDDIPGGW